MIVVIADDLSGAAELAGTAVAHGLTAEVQTAFTSQTDAQVVCVDTDTRSESPEAAAAAVEKITRAIAASRPGWIYKKCDSVLRGNVLAEIRAILASSQMSRAVLISANPSRGRTIRGGRYFVGGEPLDHTAFAHDPEHPRRTSRVAELLGGDLAGVKTPDAENIDDLDRHSAALPMDTLPAGGVEFFAALLRSRVHASAATPPVLAPDTPPLPLLFVCGSAAAWRKGRADEAAGHGVSIQPMPSELLHAATDELALRRWAAAIAAALRDTGSAMAAIAQAEPQEDVPPALLARRLAAGVAHAVQLFPVRRICAEGGATAAAVARALNWTRFTVQHQIAGGVVQLQPYNQPVDFVIKVGSYDWPPQIWPR